MGNTGAAKKKPVKESDGHLPNCSRSDRCPGDGKCK